METVQAEFWNFGQEGEGDKREFKKIPGGHTHRETRFNANQM
jgi:hypothetical protein